MQDIETLIEQLSAARQRPDVSLETDQRISDALDSIDEDLRYARQEDGFRRFVGSFLEGMRRSDDEVCDCYDAHCPPKQGDLPYMLRDVEDNFERALSDYRTQHGNPRWVRLAEDEYADRLAYVREVLDKCRMAAKNDEPTVLNGVVDDEH